jgi:hypothetical protein
MTTTVLNYSTGILLAVWSGVKKTLQGIMVGYMIARQTQANRYVVEEMIKHGEYRRDQYWDALNTLNQRTIQQIQQEFKD